jgi:hypothetical protein
LETPTNSEEKAAEVFHIFPGSILLKQNNFFPQATLA